jgi:hypothetical protein
VNTAADGAAAGGIGIATTTAATGAIVAAVPKARAGTVTIIAGIGATAVADLTAIGTRPELRN